MPLPIPLELVEYAIDTLQNDVHALAACALASRDLLPRARFHMWRQLTVPVEADPPHARMQGLLQILDSNPDIAPLVQSLTLKGVLSSSPRNPIQEYWDDPDGTMLLWEKFPNLRVLRFVQLNFSNGLHQLLPFAYSLPNLEEIALDYFDAMPPQGHPPCLPYHNSIVKLDASPKLKRLSLTGGWVLWLFLEDLAKLLLEPGMHAPLEALDLSSVVKSINTRLLPLHMTKTLPSQAWAPIIASLGQTLRHCTLGLLAEECYRESVLPSSLHSPDADISPASNLADLYGSLKQCTRLRSLGIVCNIFPVDDFDYLPFRFVDLLAELLSSDPDAPFPELRSLSLSLQWGWEPVLQGCAEACTKLAGALEDRTRYPHLKRLDVRAKLKLNAATNDGALSVEAQIAMHETVLRSSLERVELVGVHLGISVV